VLQLTLMLLDDSAVAVTVGADAGGFCVKFAVSV
jgi:hypothetical protein